eukprot:scaffold2295_cov354-Prasinococcus_capsulatus_cf.AAC.16
MQANGHVWRLITQNVDELHQRAGSTNVLELHGSSHRVMCLGCGARHERAPLQAEFARLNPAWHHFVMSSRAQADGTVGMAPGVVPTTQTSQQRRPDGDTEVDPGLDPSTFNLAGCPSCGEPLLKPAVTFFGDNVPQVGSDGRVDFGSLANTQCVNHSIVHLGNRRRVKAMGRGSRRYARGRLVNDHVLSLPASKEDSR